MNASQLKFPLTVLITSLATVASLQASLLFREDWAETPFALPITQEHVANPELQLHLYGGAVTGLKKSHHEDIPGDPYYVWSGEVTSPWLASLSHSGGPVNALGAATVRWRTRQSGDHWMRLALKLGNGNWIISGPLDGPSEDWQVTTHRLEDLQWSSLKVDPAVSLGSAIEDPDLSAVLEIGFTDLSAGDSSASSSRLDWIEFHTGSVGQLHGVLGVDFSPGSCQSDPGFLFDGNAGTRWFSEGEQEWLTVTLDREVVLDGIDIGWYRGAERFSLFEIQCSTDGLNWSALLSPTTSSGTTAETELYPCTAAGVRHVRIVGWGNEINAFNSITELRLRGRETHTLWWEDAPVRQNRQQWRIPEWMGPLSTLNSPFGYSPGVGWLYSLSASRDDVWSWVPELNWVWTSSAVFPWFYSADADAWFTFRPGDSPKYLLRLNLLSKS